MSRRLLAALMTLGALGTCAAQDSDTRQVTIAQLEQFLEAQQAAHASDGATARQLGTVELSEQLTELTIERIKDADHPGAETAAQLDVLADLSAFLEPPASEAPSKTPPTAAEQAAMLGVAREFVSETLKHLPDFLATRTTRSFEDVPVITADASFQSGMHAMGSTVREVAYRKGLEFSSTVAPGESGSKAQTERPAGLSSAGEFGPVLKTIIADSANGTIGWSRWEQTLAGLAAVFHYQVPKAAAHYLIDFCCAWSLVREEFTSYHGTPAYEGTIAIDPASGAILRLTLHAAFEDFDPPPQFGLVVQYGDVEIGGSHLMCPARSAVILRSVRPGKKHDWNVILVNDTAFTGYRRFGSTARIVPNTQAR